MERLGCKVIALDRHANAPAMQMADRSHVISMLDGDALQAMRCRRCVEGDALKTIVRREQPAFIVLEIEAIATEALVELNQQGCQVVPTAPAARRTMNREGIRRFAAEQLGLPTSNDEIAETWALAEPHTDLKLFGESTASAAWV